MLFLLPCPAACLPVEFAELQVLSHPMCTSDQSIYTISKLWVNFKNAYGNPVHTQHWLAHLSLPRLSKWST